MPAMKTLTTKFCCLFLVSCIVLAAPSLALDSTDTPSDQNNPPGFTVYPMKEGFVDVNGLFLYYAELGEGQPLIILHGGPGGSHNYFLPFLLPLARNNRIIFMDERGS